MRRRLGVLVVALLSGGVWAANAAAAPATEHTHLAPAPTSVDHVSCGIPAPAPAVTVAPGGTAVTFTLVAPGCE
jgi:hypothetical protein